jgi:CubicO group peptidase (beta-lactamase class C family)
MHEDPSGIDDGAYGLRLRPIDMQKFGNLFLNDGCWNGHQLISTKWVKQSFTPWIRSGENTYGPDYGWYWWKDMWDYYWTSFAAVGWKGQRIEVFPEQKMVVTMTALINDGSENRVFADLVHNYVTHLTDPLPSGSNIDLIKAKLKRELVAVRTAPSRIERGTEPRMIPTTSNKERHFPFTQTIK